MNLVSEKLVVGIRNIFQKIDNELSEVFSEQFSVWQKEDKSFVTSLDIQIQSIIVRIIKAYYPDHNILCEEGVQRYLGLASDFTWVIDPIDGTHNFIKGKKEYGVSIGLMYKEEFISAYINFPQIKECYYSIEGLGVFKNWENFPSLLKGNSNIVALCSKSYPKLKSSFEILGLKTICFYCATYSMLKLLKNEVVLYHTINTNIYDVGPMAFILKKTGIPSFNENKSFITFLPDLKKIPVFTATTNNSLLQIL